MRRSCLVGLLLVAAVLLAASFWLQRFLTSVSDTPAEAGAPAATLEAAGASALESLPTLPAPVLAEGRIYEERIEGLYLETVLPLAESALDIRGLAAVEGSLYATAYDPGGPSAWLHELDRSSGAIRRSLPLHELGPGEPCGLQGSGQLLWTCINAPGGALILGIDRVGWGVAARTAVTDTLRTVAQAEDGTFVGVDGQGRWFYRWGADGTLERAAANATGALYSDCELIRGSLVCAGREGERGVLDVLDPGSLTLLARHRATTRTLWGALVAENALAYDGQQFLLVPPGGELPLVWVYRLEQGSLADYVPSVRPSP